MAFNRLPIELNQHIAHCLESDKDICNFRGICQNTYNAVDGDRYSFWRAKYRALFPLDPVKSNTVLRKEYQSRRKYLRIGTNVKFAKGERPKELKVLEVLRALICDSFLEPVKPDTNGRRVCRNQQHLIKFIKDSRNFLDVKRELRKGAISVSPKLAAIQLMLAHFLFEQEPISRDIYAFEISQKMVYESSKEQPIFTGFNNCEVNMEWVLHCLNFFRYHLMTAEAQSLHEQIAELDPSQRPSPWQSQLCDPAALKGSDLSRCWKGTYAYLDRGEVNRLRQSQFNDGEVFIDKNIEPGGVIQTLELETIPCSKAPWPQLFEQHLHSIPPKYHARTRAQHRSKSSDADSVSFRFAGEGEDDEHFFASGWLNPLAPQPAGLEIPGWQRVTFMKHFISEEEHVDEDHLWAYEGVLLPGGHLMLGRWWFADEDSRTEYEYSGPFIFWAVESEPESTDNGS